MWFKYALIVIFALDAVLCTFTVGETRTPRTAFDAGVQTLFDIVIILGIVHYF